MNTVGAHALFGTRPLEGKRIVLTRPRAQAGDFETRILALGGEPVLAPAIALTPPESWTIVDAALRRVETYDWIAFTSANALRSLVDRADAIGVARDVMRGRRLAVVGPATAAAVTESLRAPDVVSAEHTANALAREIPDVENERFLFPRGDLASDALPAGLRLRGAFVDDVTAYRTVPGDGVAIIASLVRAGSVDALLFTSSSAVRFVADALVGPARVDDGGPRTLDVPNHVAVMCIGHVTAHAARAAGLEPAVIAESATQDDLIDCVVSWFVTRDNYRDG